MTKKPKTVRVGDIEVTPVTAAEHRSIARKIRKRYARLRKRYKEIRGKKVDWIEHTYEEGSLYVGVRFMDGTYFSLDFSPQIVTDGIEFSDMSTGDEEILKTYYRRRD
ncbi:MAG: hypothetical protein DMG78_23180 [Acidobacteria bacterium]|nr:MAG: hypothetical protein DMG78_23180 [Acidobacteriota bacterium]